MKHEARPIKIDRRLTGANIIDEPLQQVSFNIKYLNIFSSIGYGIFVTFITKIFV